MSVKDTESISVETLDGKVSHLEISGLGDQVYGSVIDQPRSMTGASEAQDVVFF